MDDIDKQWGTSPPLHQALCTISNPSVNSNWSYSPETLNSGRNWWFFFVPCDLEISWMTLENNIAPLVYYVKLCALFQNHGWIQIGVTIRKRSGQNRQFFVSCDLEIWQMTLKNNRTPLLYYLKLCASFQSHEWIHTGVTVRKRLIWVNINIFLAVCPWNWQLTLEKSRAPLPYCFKLCASFHNHQ